MKAFQPLESKCRSEQAAERIMEMIRTGELSVGDKLPPEQEFAKQLGISRGILREGLAQLKAQGLITRKPKDGTYIQDPAQKHRGGAADSVARAFEGSTFRSIMEMRDAVEQKACAMVVESATDEELDGLRNSVLSRRNDRTNEEADSAFHCRLAELTGNPIFVSIVDTYFKEVEALRQRNTGVRVIWPDCTEEHMTIVDALTRRDSAAAMRAVERHVLLAGEQLCRLAQE